MKIVDKSYKNMASDSRIIRLHQINKKLDICFDYNDEEERRRHGLTGGAAAVGTVGAVGYGGYKLNSAIRSRQGAMNAMFTGTPRTGYLGAASNLAASNLQAGANIARQGPAAVGQAAMSGLRTTGSSLKTTGSSLVKKGSSALEAILKKVKAFRG